MSGVSLCGKKIVFLVTHGTEQSEFTDPWQARLIAGNAHGALRMPKKSHTEAQLQDQKSFNANGTQEKRIEREQAKSVAPVCFLRRILEQHLERSLVMNTTKIGIVFSLLATACLAAKADEQNPRSERSEGKRAERRETREENRKKQQDGDNEQHQDKHEQALSKFFAGRLMLMHHSSILMSDFAAREASSEDVKAFADKLHKSHAMLNRKLGDLAPEIVSITSLDSAGRPGLSGQKNTLPVEQKSKVGIDEVVRDKESIHKEMNSDNLLHRVLSVERQATQNYLQSTTEMLSRYKGQDFDMGFLGFQIGSHTWELAELKAMASIGNDEFREVIKETTEEIEQHLKEAQTLSKQRSDDDDKDQPDDDDKK